MTLQCLTAEDRARFEFLQEDVQPEEGELLLTEAALATWALLKTLVLEEAQKVDAELRHHGFVAMGSRRNGGLNLVVDTCKPERSRLSVDISPCGSRLTVFWVRVGRPGDRVIKDLPWDPDRMRELLAELLGCEEPS